MSQQKTLILPPNAVRKRLSIVFSGRNDSYGGDFTSKLLSAWKRNSLEFYCRGIDVEWIFVEWNPLNSDYLSHRLAPLGFKCFVVDNSLHKRVCKNPRLEFMQFFAKNVGIRQATNDWVLSTNADVIYDPATLNYLFSEELDSKVIYRAERCDIKQGLFKKEFKEINENIIFVHDSRSGTHYTQAAGDFTLFNKREIDFGYDETIAFSDAYLDGRFLENWREIRKETPELLFRFIGRVFKEDHPLTYRRTADVENHHKGRLDWDYTTQLPYSMESDWGFTQYLSSQIAPGIWFLEDQKKNPAPTFIRSSGQERQDLTLFALPKANIGHIKTIQTNAIMSWTQLTPRPNILLLGDDEGVSELAQELGVTHIPSVERNEFGTPIVSDIFYKAQENCSSPLLAYVNADIILFNNFVESINRIHRQHGEFLMIGQRWDVDVEHLIDYSDDSWKEKLKELLYQKGQLHSVTGIDYFAFNRGLWSAIPPFAIGRLAWDNWLVGTAVIEGKPVIDATKGVLAIHQNHKYIHVGGKDSAAGAAWNGREATINKSLAGGVVQKGLATHAPLEMSKDGDLLEKNALPEQKHVETGKTPFFQFMRASINYFEQEKFPECLAMINQAREQGYFVKGLLNLYGLASYLLNKREQAIAAFKEELEIFPGNDKARANLSDLVDPNEERKILCDLWPGYPRFQTEAIECVLKSLPPGEKCLQLGGELSTVHFSRILPRESLWHCMEENESLCEELESLVKLQGIDNIRIHSISEKDFKTELLKLTDTNFSIVQVERDIPEEWFNAIWDLTNQNGLICIPDAQANDSAEPLTRDRFAVQCIDPRVLYSDPEIPGDNLIESRLLVAGQSWTSIQQIGLLFERYFPQNRIEYKISRFLNEYRTTNELTDQRSSLKASGAFLS